MAALFLCVLLEMLDDLDEELEVDLGIGKVGIGEAGDQVKHLLPGGFEIGEDLSVGERLNAGDDGIIEGINVHLGMGVSRVGLMMADDLDADTPPTHQVGQQGSKGRVPLAGKELLLLRRGEDSETVAVSDPVYT